jgi:hypothetical protein
MARYKQTLDTTLTCQEALAYLSDFSNERRGRHRALRPGRRRRARPQPHRHALSRRARPRGRRARRAPRRGHQRLYQRYTREQLELVLAWVREGRQFNERQAAALEQRNRES